MRPDLTDITLVVDRSGSMAEVREDAEGGVNTFIGQQAKEPGEALLTLVQFDTEYEFLHTGVPVQSVPKYELVPRGMTALLDAVGRAINETGEKAAFPSTANTWPWIPLPTFSPKSSSFPKKVALREPASCPVRIATPRASLKLTQATRPTSLNAASAEAYLKWTGASRLFVPFDEP